MWFKDLLRLDWTSLKVLDFHVQEHQTRRTSNININPFKYWLMHPNYGLGLTKMMQDSNQVGLASPVLVLCQQHYYSAARGLFTLLILFWKFELIWKFFFHKWEDLHFLQVTGTQMRQKKIKGCPETEPALEPEPGAGSVGSDQVC